MVVRVHAFGGRKAQRIPVEQVDAAERCVAKRANASDDCLEYRLRIGLRLADHAQDLARRRLLFQRFGQVDVAHLQFLEQPHVLDGDHGLVRKRLQQLDLRIRKWARHIAIDGDRADRLDRREAWARRGRFGSRPPWRRRDACIPDPRERRRYGRCPGQNGPARRTAAVGNRGIDAAQRLFPLGI